MRRRSACLAPLLALVMPVVACAPDASAPPPPGLPTAQGTPSAPRARPLPAPPEIGVEISGDNMEIRGEVRIRPGTYHVADTDGDGVLHVRGAETRLDLTGVTLIGVAAGDPVPADTYTGLGVVVGDAAGACVIGGAVRGFKVAIAVRGSPGALVQDVDVSGNFRQHLHSTPEKEDVRDWLRPHDNDEGEWETKYGAGISLTDSPGADVHRCRARDGQNGLLVTRSDRTRAYDNDFSFLSGWGIALYRTSDAVVCRNRLDWCVRGYSHGVYDRGQDSAGILVFEQCCRNTFALNSATHGGDGFFLYAGEETVERTGRGGSNDNVVVQNDFSHAVANAIEATFSSGNRFLENRLDDARHGVWAGYSSDTLIRGNSIRHADNGVSIEHGQRNAIADNEITDCGTGVHLWWDDDTGLFATAFGKTRDVRSTGNRIGPWNHFATNRVDIRLDTDTDSRVVDNAFSGVAANVALAGNCAGTLLGGNTARDTVIAVDAAHEGRVRWVPAEGALGRPAVSGTGDVHVERAEPDGMLHRGHAPDVDDALDVSTLPGTLDTALPADMPRGRAAIQVDDWGPIDPRVRALRPATQEASGSAVLRVTGSGKAWRVVTLTPGWTPKPRDGALPGVVELIPPPGRAYSEFAVEVEIAGEVRRATGHVLATSWDVRFFHWEIDPRDDAAAWSALLEGEPAYRSASTGLDFAWGSGAPQAGVPADHFGTLATTEVELPAGAWRIDTVSDDGIRVWIDDDLVIDDWTHHAPTGHAATCDLAAGVHRIRVEHFELDGWAVLRVGLRPE